MYPYNSQSTSQSLCSTLFENVNAGGKAKRVIWQHPPSMIDSVEWKLQLLHPFLFLSLSLSPLQVSPDLGPRNSQTSLLQRDPL